MHPLDLIIILLPAGLVRRDLDTCVLGDFQLPR